MRESDTYMAIIEEGQLDQTKMLILRSGRKSLGAPNDAVTTALAGIADLERLERIHDRLGEVGSWQELLATP